MIEEYISADGFYAPCCWIGNHPKLSALRDFLGDRWSDLDVKANGIDSVRCSPAVQMIESSWEQGTLQPCVDFCGEPFNPDENHYRDEHLWISLAGDA